MKSKNYVDDGQNNHAISQFESCVSVTVSWDGASIGRVQLLGKMSYKLSNVGALTKKEEGLVALLTAESGA